MFITTITTITIIIITIIIIKSQIIFRSLGLALLHRLCLCLKRQHKQNNRRMLMPIGSDVLHFEFAIVLLDSGLELSSRPW